MKHQRDNSTVYNMDNMEFMRGVEDKYFDLAIVDPPYGIGIDGQKESISTNRFHHDFKGWDTAIPDKEYFIELFRVSENQIIWGGNYMVENLKNSRCWLIWDKIQEFSGADFEMAWTSFNKSAKAFRMSRVEAYTNQKKIHPTQKPVALYEWIYKNYLPNGGKVIDTHLGSGSNRISAFKRGNIIFDACELDVDYFNDGNDRYDEFLMKYQPAELNPITKQGQTKLF